MKKLIILSAVIALVMSSCGTSAKSPKTEQDSLAYAMGINIGMYIKNVDSTANVDMIAAAAKAFIANKSAMTQEEAMNFLQTYFTVTLPAKEEAASNEFLAEIEKSNKNVKKTETGILYEVITEGDAAAKPASLTDTVKVSYEGKLKSGVVFDSSYERGDTVSFPLNRVIPGWGEGMQLVGKGGKIKLWIPAALGYGAMGQGPIGPNQALIFEVELHDVMHGPAAE